MWDMVCPVCCVGTLLFKSDTYPLRPKVHLAHRVPVDLQEVAASRERKVFLVLLASLASLDRRETLVFQDSR